MIRQAKREGESDFKFRDDALIIPYVACIPELTMLAVLPSPCLIFVGRGLDESSAMKVGIFVPYS